MRSDNGVLSWLHIGDLHITRAGEQNHDEFKRIVALANSLSPDSLDFALLPGDNTDGRAAGQFELVRNAADRLRLPLHILPGDHDFKPRCLDAFYRVLGAAHLPYATTVKGHRCLFLDAVSAGSGGPDFRLDAAQLDWVERELEAAQAVVAFMHTYPADLREGSERLRALLARPRVHCVGHKHYNELATDGCTIFMTTRSTGQIEEGPPGFSIAAIDAGCVSWRFKPLHRAWPFVLVSRPADRRLVTAPNATANGVPLVRAQVAGDWPIEAVEVKVGDGDWTPMTPAPGETAVWQAARGALDGSIRVRAQDARGRQDEDQIEPAIPGWAPPLRAVDGSDRDRVGAWPEKGILDTQLGSNRNGQEW